MRTATIICELLLPCLGREGLVSNSFVKCHSNIELYVAMYHYPVTSRKLRICLITREYPPETGWGGIATFSRHLAHGLKELGHNVTVVSLSKDFDKTQDDDGVHVHRIRQESLGSKFGHISTCMPYSRYVMLTSLGLWKKFIDLHRQEPFDVVDTPELLADGLYPAVTRLLPMVVRLYTPHSKFIAEKLHNVSPSFDHQLVAALERIAMLSADRITSPSQDLADYVARDLNYDRDRISLIYNPIDPDQFAPDGPTAIARDGRLTVLFVGRLEERKGIHYLIDAVPEVLKECSNVRFVIVGDDTNSAVGGTSVLAELKDQIRKNKCEAAITFINRVALSELPAYYRSADICVVPSVYDNSPYTSLEAMSCGRPVIGTAGGGTKEYVAHEETGLIVPVRDSEALANALLDLLRDSEKRERFGVNARKRVLAKFQRTEIARQTLELYESARESFAVRTSTSLYSRPIEDIAQDATELIASFNKMIYELLYQYSWRFRVRHWLTLIRSRPRLSLAKVCLRSTKVLSDLTGNKLRVTRDATAWLNAEIARRQQEISAATQEV